MRDPKHCLTGHPLQHSLTGAGLALILVKFIPALADSTGFWLGVVLFVIGLAGEMKAKKGEQ